MTLVSGYASAQDVQDLTEGTEALATRIGTEVSGLALALNAAQTRADDAYELAEAADAPSPDDILYTQPGVTGAVPRSLSAYLSKGPLYAGDFGVTADGTTDDTAALQVAVNAMIQSKRPLILPAGTIVTTGTIFIRPSEFLLLYFASFAAEPRISGFGRGCTLFDHRVNGPLFDVDSTNDHSTFKSILGGYIGDFSVFRRTPTATVGGHGVRVRGCIGMTIQNIHFVKLSGKAVDVVCDLGDLDAPVSLTMRNLRADNCAGGGFDVAATAPNNEVGLVLMEQCSAQQCGTSEQRTITGITNAATPVVTYTGTPVVDGARMRVDGVSGMTQINGLNGTVANATPTTFELVGVNTSAMGTFSAGTGVGTCTTASLVTIAAHGYAAGQLVVVSGTGTALDGQTVQVSTPTADTLSLRSASGLKPVISTLTPGAAITLTRVYKAIAYDADPQSFGFRIKCQMTVLMNCGGTLNHNATFVVEGGAGLPQDIAFINTTSENPAGIGWLFNGVRGVRVIGGHTYSNNLQAGGWSPAGMVFDGTHSLVSHCVVEQQQVRSTSDQTHYTAFAIAGQFADRNSIKVRGTIWKQFYSHQTRFKNVAFEPVEIDCAISAISANDMRLAPKTGRNIPVRARYAVGDVFGFDASTTGEWVSREIGASGVNWSVSQGLDEVDGSGVPLVVPANTMLYFYVYEQDNVLRMRPSTVAPTFDTEFGYEVKTGEPWKLYVGRNKTQAGSNQLEITNASYARAIEFPGVAAGAVSRFWFNEADRTLRLRTSGQPSSAADSNFQFYAGHSFIASGIDLPSIPPLSAHVVSVPTTGMANGDWNCGISLSVGFGGLIAFAEVLGATTSVTFFNPTASAITRPTGASIRLLITRR